MTILLRRAVLVCTAVVLILGGGTARASSSDAGSFYAGKTVRIIVGYGAGGGFDVYARVIARHLGDHLPGKPTVIVENMPGGGGLVAANALYNTLPKDGTVIAHVLGELVLLQVLGYQPAQFNAHLFNYIGAPTPDTPVCAARSDAHVTNIGQLRTASAPMTFAGQGPGTNTDDPPNVARIALKLNLKMIDGYQGTHAMQLAVEQGETQAACLGWESMKVTWAQALGDKSIVPIARSESSTDDPMLKSVPEFVSFATDDHARQLIRLGIDAPSKFQRIFIAPPGVPGDRVAALRAAFDATMSDPQFLADAKTAKLSVAPITGAAIEKLVSDVFAMPAGVKAELSKAILPQQ